MMSSACVLLADARHMAVPGARASDLVTGLAMVYLRVRSLQQQELPRKEQSCLNTYKTLTVKYLKILIYFWYV